MVPAGLELVADGGSFSLAAFDFNEKGELIQTLQPFVASVPFVKSATNLLSDLEGGVRVNLTTQEFSDLVAASKAGEADVQIAVPKEPAKSTVLVDNQPLPELVAEKGLEPDFELPATKWLGETDMSVYSAKGNKISAETRSGN